MPNERRIKHPNAVYKVTHAMEVEIKTEAAVLRQLRRPIEDLSTAWVTIRDRHGYSRLPLHAKRYLDGYYRAVWDGLWLWADWRVYWRGAYYYSLAQTSPEKDAIGHGTAPSAVLITDWSEVDAEKGWHFWIGSDVPFSKAWEPGVNEHAEIKAGTQTDPEENS